MVRSTKFGLLLRYTSASMTVFLSGWLLLVYWGLREEVEAKLVCWTCAGELPSHPLMRMKTALIFAVALPFGAAWLIPTRNSEIEPHSPAGKLVRTYPFRLILSFVCALLVALLLVGVAMLTLDSGLG
jgi:hypothetical protein